MENDLAGRRLGHGRRLAGRGWLVRLELVCPGPARSDDGARLQSVSSDAAKPKIGVIEDAEIHRAAGEYYLRTNKPGCAGKADEQFNTARSFLMNATPGNDRSALLIDLAVAQVELGGNDDEVLKELRKNWDHTQKMVRQTLQYLALDAYLEGLSIVTRALIERGQSARAPNLARSLKNDPESLAVVGLEFIQAGNRESALKLAREALKFYPPTAKPTQDKPLPGAPPSEKPAPDKLPLSPALVALCTSLKSELSRTDFKSVPLPSEDADLQSSLKLLLARAAKEDANPLFRLRLLLATAATAPDSNPSAGPELKAAADLIDKENLVSPWQSCQFVRLALRSDTPLERIDGTVNRIRDGEVKARARLEVLRARLKRQKEKATVEPLKDVDEKAPAQALAREVIARHNASLDKSSAKAVDSWEERFRPFGHAGAALGMQDGRK